MIQNDVLCSVYLFQLETNYFSSYKNKGVNIKAYVRFII